MALDANTSIHETRPLFAPSAALPSEDLTQPTRSRAIAALFGLAVGVVAASAIAVLLFLG